MILSLAVVIVKSLVPGTIDPWTDLGQHLETGLRVFPQRLLDASLFRTSGVIRENLKKTFKKVCSVGI